MKSKLLSGSTAQRLAWGALSVVLFYQYFHLVGISVQWHYNHPFIWPTWLLGLVTMEMAILYNHPLAIKLRKSMNMPSRIAIAFYIALSGILLWIIDLGWNGCFFIGQSDMSCMKTVFAVWDYFPITNPSIEMILLSFHGFGGRNEMVGVFSTFLVGLGLVMALSAASDDRMTFTQKFLPSVVIISCMEGGFYGLFTITQSVDSWPGVVVCILIAAIALMLDWWNKRTSSNVEEEKNG